LTKRAHLQAREVIEINDLAMKETLSKMSTMLVRNKETKLQLEYLVQNQENLVYIEPLQAKFFCCNVKDMPSPLFFRINKDDEKNLRELGKVEKDLDV